MKQSKTFKERLEDRSQKNMILVNNILGITNDEYYNLVFICGLSFISERLPIKMQDIDKYKGFWGWWKLQYLMTEDKFLADYHECCDLEGMEREELIDVFRTFQIDSADNIDSILINAFNRVRKNNHSNLSELINS